MMEEKITALLRTICPRTFPDVAPLETPRPYCTWQVIGGDVLEFLDNSLPNKENGMVQVTIWSDTRLEAKTLIKQVEAAMLAATDMQASPIAAAASDYDADMDLRSCRQDFSVWADR